MVRWVLMPPHASICGAANRTDIMTEGYWAWELRFLIASVIESPLLSLCNSLYYTMQRDSRRKRVPKLRSTKTLPFPVRNRDYLHYNASNSRK